MGTPSEINLKMVSERPEQKDFIGNGNYPVAVLLEGQFHSVFENRVMPFQEKTFESKGKKK